MAQLGRNIPARFLANHAMFPTRSSARRAKAPESLVRDQIACLTRSAVPLVLNGLHHGIAEDRGLARRQKGETGGPGELSHRPPLL